VAGGSSGRRRGIVAEINVTPLVDIMLVLLITFMLTAHIVQKRRAIEVALPRASQSSNIAPTTLALTLTREGALYLNGTPVTPTELQAAVKAALRKDPRTQATIAGDKAVSHGRVVWLLDTIKALGITSFAIQIDPTEMVAPSAP
jgi:biopolymer transport protein ExbD